MAYSTFSSSIKEWEVDILLGEGSVSHLRCSSISMSTLNFMHLHTLVPCSQVHVCEDGFFHNDVGGSNEDNGDHKSSSNRDNDSVDDESDDSKSAQNRNEITSACTGNGCPPTSSADRQCQCSNCSQVKSFIVLRVFMRPFCVASYCV